MERNMLPCLWLCLINIYLCSAAATGVDFTCDSSNRVVLSKTTDLSKLRVVQNDGNFCKPKTENFTNCKVTDPSDIRVIFTEEQDENVAGGRNLSRYEVMCKDKKQVVKVSVTDIPVTEPTKQSYSTKSVSTKVSVTMAVKKNGKDLTTAVSIGEKLTLEIKGPANHTIRPENCTANDGLLTHELWRCGSHDDAIIGKDWKLATDIVTNDLYAFRFINTKKVNIECYVSVCPGLTSTGCQLNVCNTNGRRRRDADDFPSNDGLSSEDAVASVSFNVKGDETFNKSPGLLADTLLFTVAVFTAMLSIR